MAEADRSRIAGFSVTVRNSTLRRLRAVPEGAENWAIGEGAMSFADIAHHLLQCDYGLMKVFETDKLVAHVGSPGLCVAESRQDYMAILEELQSTKSERHDFIMMMTQEQLDRVLDVERARGTERIPSGILVLEMLDHEIHHRGQVATYLRVHQATPAVGA